jgi:Tfp pilus assembly protein PilV
MEFLRMRMPSGIREVRTMLKMIRHDEGGYAIVEIIVSSILLVTVAVGVFGAFDAATRSTAEERHRARAHAIAEADLSRMRALRISDLANLSETRTITQDDTPYTIDSRAEFVTDSTGTASCEAGVASADYLQISSTVRWPSIGSRPPVYASSIVAPPNGSVSADSGSLAIAVEDSQSVGVPGVGVSGSGAGSFSGVTGPDGCVIIGNLPAGNYTVTVTASGLVDPDGLPPEPIDTSVVAESTNTLVLQYDEPGSIPVTFTTIPYGGGTPVASNSESIIAFNTGMSSARAFPPTPGARVSQIDATSLFPFSSDYAVYSGTCEGDNPNPFNLDPAPAPLAILSALVPPGGSAPPPTTIQQPAMHVTVYQGTNTGSARAAGATLKIKDTRCSNFQRNFTTNSVGRLADPGFPYSDYQVCAYYPPTNRKKTTTVSMNDPNDVTGGQTVNIFMGTGTTSGVCT